MTKKIKKRLKLWLLILLALANIALLWTHYWNYQKEKQLKKQIENLQTNLSQLESQENIKKIFIAKQIKRNNWYNIINQLFDAYSSINNLQTPTFVIQNMNIDLDKIKFMWYSNSWKNIYSSWWIIEKIAALDFINTLEIPSYQTKDNLIYFSLTAKLKTNGKQK